MGNLSFETNILQFQQVIDRKPRERHNQSVEFEDDINALFETYQKLLPMAEEDDARLWTKFRLDWNYNSNRIEGNTLTRGETKALLEEGIKPIRMRKDILQMQSHDKAIDFLKELVESDAPLTEVDIRDLHKTALGENYWTEAITAENVITKREIKIGVYKKVPNIVLKSDGTTHEYAAPNEVTLRMAATLKTIRQYLKKPDLALHDFMAELHQDFIQTHPFDDGNGRMVRLLINYVCLKLGWPPVIIKSEKRADYIAALESWNDGNETPFRKLMKEELTWSLKKSIQAARGENIDDPEDLDKEIDLFVREKKEVFDRKDIKKKNLHEISINDFQEICGSLVKKLHKFSPVFVKFEDNRNYLEFDKTTLRQIGTKNIKRNELKRSFLFLSYRGEDVLTNVGIYVSHQTIGKDAFIDIFGEIYENSGLASRSVLPASTRFFKNKTSFEYTKTKPNIDVPQLTKNIVKDFLYEIKNFN